MSDEWPGHSTTNTARDVSGTAFMAHNLTVHYVDSATSERAEHAFGLQAPPLYVNQAEPQVEAQRIIDEGSGVSTLLTVYAPGQGGGTTAFGLKFLYDSFERDRGRFPGGYFYVDLAREDPGVAVGHFLRLMGFPEEDIPNAPALRLRKLHHTPQWRRGAAVMIDSPRSITDVLPFYAASPGSLTVVAGSQQFDLRTLGRDDLRLLRHANWEDIALEDLSVEHATAMFCQQAKVAPADERERAMVADFVAAAGGNPGLIADYALEVQTERRLRAADPLAAAHLHLFGAGSVPGQHPRDRPDFAGLTEDERGLAVLLAQHPDSDFGAGLAVALLDGAAEPGTVREQLDLLVERGVLVIVTEGPQPRYRFTTRSMRSTFAPDTEKPLDTPRRVLTHYYEIAYAAHGRLMPGRWLQADLDGRSAFPDSARSARSFESVDEARQALIPERHTMVRVVLDAVAAGHYAMAAELCEVLWPFWFHSGYFTDVVDAQVPLVKAALDTHHLDPARLSRLCVQTAIAYRRDENRTGARREAERALDLAEGAHPLVVLTAYDALGDIEVDEGLHDAAIGRFAAARRIAEGMDPVDRRALHIMERKEGMAHQRAGRLAEAERLILHAQGLLTDGDHQNRARTHSALGELRVSQGRVDDALKEYDAAVRLHRLLGDLRRVGDVHVARADAAGSRDPVAARTDLERALEAYESAEAGREADAVRGRLGA